MYVALCGFLCIIRMIWYYLKNIYICISFIRFQVQSKASTVSSSTRTSANIQQAAALVPNQQHQPQSMHNRNSIGNEQEKSSRVRRRSVSPTELNNDQDAESYYQQHNDNYNNHNINNKHHQSMTTVAESHQRNSIQEMNTSHESPYSKDNGDPQDGTIHAITGGTSSKYSLLQFAAQHFRNE